LCYKGLLRSRCCGGIIELSDGLLYRSFNRRGAHFLRFEDQGPSITG